MCAAAESLRGEGLRVRRLILVCPVNPFAEDGRRVAPFLGTPFWGSGISLGGGQHACFYSTVTGGWTPISQQNSRR